MSDPAGSSGEDEGGGVERRRQGSGISDPVTYHRHDEHLLRRLEYALQKEDSESFDVKMDWDADGLPTTTAPLFRVGVPLLIFSAYLVFDRVRHNMPIIGLAPHTGLADVWMFKFCQWVGRREVLDKAGEWGDTQLWLRKTVRSAHRFLESDRGQKLVELTTRRIPTVVRQRWMLPMESPAGRLVKGALGGAAMVGTMMLITPIAPLLAMGTVGIMAGCGPLIPRMQDRFAFYKENADNAPRTVGERLYRGASFVIGRGLAPYTKGELLPFVRHPMLYLRGLDGSLRSRHADGQRSLVRRGATAIVGLPLLVTVAASKGVGLGVKYAVKGIIVIPVGQTIKVVRKLRGKDDDAHGRLPPVPTRVSRGRTDELELPAEVREAEWVEDHFGRHPKGLRGLKAVEVDEVFRKLLGDGLLADLREADDLDSREAESKLKLVIRRTARVSKAGSSEGARVWDRREVYFPGEYGETPGSLALAQAYERVLDVSTNERFANVVLGEARSKADAERSHADADAARLHSLDPLAGAYLEALERRAAIAAMREKGRKVFDANAPAGAEDVVGAELVRVGLDREVLVDSGRSMMRASRAPLETAAAVAGFAALGGGMFATGHAALNHEEHEHPQGPEASNRRDVSASVDDAPLTVSGKRGGNGAVVGGAGVRANGSFDASRPVVPGPNDLGPVANREHSTAAATEGRRQLQRAITTAKSQTAQYALTPRSDPAVARDYHVALLNGVEAAVKTGNPKDAIGLATTYLWSTAPSVTPLPSAGNGAAVARAVADWRSGSKEVVDVLRVVAEQRRGLDGLELTPDRTSARPKLSASSAKGSATDYSLAVGRSL